MGCALVVRFNCTKNIRVTKYVKRYQIKRKDINKMKKKVMLSNGLRGKRNPDEYVTQCREALAQWGKANNVEYELLHSYRPDEYREAIAKLGEQNARIAMLGSTITQELAQCDILVLVDDWYSYDGCTIEFEIAKRYGKEIAFISS